MATISLKQNNLYRNGKIIEDTFGDSVLFRPQITAPKSETDIYHIVRDFDRLDLIAYRYYKDKVEDSSKYWWVIADINDIENPLDISNLVGSSILIPDILRILLLL